MVSITVFIIMSWSHLLLAADSILINIYMLTFLERIANLGG